MPKDIIFPFLFFLRHTLHRARASSAQELQPRLRQISKTERAILGALEETYIMSAIKEKLSTLARDTYACTEQCIIAGEIYKTGSEATDTTSNRHDNALKAERWTQQLLVT